MNVCMLPFVSVQMQQQLTRREESWLERCCQGCVLGPQPVAATAAAVAVASVAAAVAAVAAAVAVAAVAAVVASWGWVH